MKEALDVELCTRPSTRVDTTTALKRHILLWWLIEVTRLFFSISVNKNFKRFDMITG